jgi:hypothetical protein
MIPNRDQTYSYIFCGPRAETVTYYETPTTVLGDSSITFRSSGSLAKSAGSTLGNLNQTLVSTSSAAGGARLKEPHSSSNNLGAIIGGTLGGIALLCLIALAIVWVGRRREKAPQHVVPEYMSSTERQPPGYSTAPKADRVYEMSGRQIQPSQELSSSWHNDRTELPGSTI